MADSSEQETRCIRCGAQYDKKDQYCTGCGAPVVNRCMDNGNLLREPCGHVNRTNASFCAKCGSVTAFNKAGLMPSPLEENKVLEQDELSEMDWFSHQFFAD